MCVKVILFYDLSILKILVLEINIVFFSFFVFKYVKMSVRVISMYLYGFSNYIELCSFMVK